MPDSTRERLTFGKMQNPVRGFLHGAAAAASLVGTVLLWTRGAGDVSRQLALLVFGVSLLALYTVSSLYHSVPWREPWKARMQRLDHAMIYVLVAGTYTPPFRALTKQEDEDVVQMINAAAPDIVWVGLGTPKQEYWMADHVDRLEAPVLIGVGAAFDFHAGLKRQAPRWMQQSGLEWLFRLSSEPRRLWKRYLLNNPAFVWLALEKVWRTAAAAHGSKDPSTAPPERTVA